MKRRKFLLTSGTALLGSASLNSVLQRPAIALNFDLVQVDSADPSNTGSILVDFQNFELLPRYVDENAGDATIKITLTVENHGSKTTQTDVSLTNGQVTDKSDLKSAIPIVRDDISSSRSSLDCQVKVSVDHPSVSDSYKQSFTIRTSSTSSGSVATVQDGLVGWWPLHEWSGRANDLSGNGNHGNVNGSTRSLWGRGGLTSYNFDGSDNVNIGKGVPSPNNNTFTISAWIRTSGSASFDDIFAVNDTSTQSAALELRKTDANNVQFGYKDGGNDNSVTSNSTIGDDSWHHIVGVRDVSSQVSSLYIDGGLDAESSWSTVANLADSSDYLIGAIVDNTGSVDKNWVGNIQDVRYYNRTLSSQEIQTLYELGSQDYTKSSLHNGTDSGAVSRYEFDGDVADSWNNNNGTENSATGFSNNAIQGKSKIFDGTNYISATNPRPDSGYTISLWFNANNTSNSRMIHFLNNKRLVLDVYNGNVRHVHDDSDSNFGTTYVLKEPVSTNNWYNVVASWTGSQMRLYLNGSLVGTQDVSGFSNRDGTDEFGRRGDDGTQVFDDTYFDGEMDDIRLYNRALSLDEVQELYQWGTRGQDLRQVTTTDNTKDMVGWWKLNETDGSTAYDSSGNGVNGTCKNGAGPSGTGTVSSPLGQSAYSLDGIDDEINISGISSPTNVVSFSFWLYPRAVNDGDYDRYLTLEGENGNLYTEIRDEGDGTFHFYLNNSSDNFPEVTHPISNNEWHHWIGVYDGSVQRLYRDGVEVGTNTHDNNGTATVGDNIGSKGGAGFGDIAIDDLRVYSRALTPQEISYLYERKF